MNPRNATARMRPPSPRRSYEAKLLVIELDLVERAWLTPDIRLGVQLVRLAADTGEAEEPSRVESLIRDADIVVLLAEDLIAVSPPVVVAVSRAAAELGRAVAAVITSPSATWRGEVALRTMSVLRDEVDTVLILEDVRLAAALIDVLRGGTRRVEQALTR